jgi:hypothetical protein
MLRISLDALLTVDTIARRGTFSAAAKELYRVPSTISYTVSKLEEDLGVQLFERFGPRVVLTAAGEELLKEGRYLLKAAADLESRVRRVASGWETEFTIGVDSALAPLGLQDDIRAFLRSRRPDPLAHREGSPVRHLGKPARPPRRPAGGRRRRRALRRRLHRRAAGAHGLRVRGGAFAPAGHGRAPAEQGRPGRSPRGVGGGLGAHCCRRAPSACCSARTR